MKLYARNAKEKRAIERALKAAGSRIVYKFVPRKRNPRRRRKLGPEAKASLDAHKILSNKLKTIAGKVPHDVYLKMVDAANRTGERYIKARRKGNSRRRSNGMMLKCAGCGHLVKPKIRKGKGYCPNCGKRLKSYLDKK